MHLPKIIGHRGACAYAPENTIASFDKALALGCSFIEFDVMCSQDGEPFVFHDACLNRTSNGKGDIGASKADYIRGLDAGSWFSKNFKGEKIPHFKDALSWLIQAKIQANIEIKACAKTMYETTKTILDHVQQYWPIEHSLPLLSSFDFEVLFLARSILPEMPRALLIHHWDHEYLEKAKQLQCYSIHFNQRILTEERVLATKKQGYGIGAYTVNHKSLANKLFSWGVDAIFTDYPDLII